MDGDEDRKAQPRKPMRGKHDATGCHSGLGFRVAIISRQFLYGVKGGRVGVGDFFVYLQVFPN